jgi:hypothetical protein
MPETSLHFRSAAQPAQRTRAERRSGLRRVTVPVSKIRRRVNSKLSELAAKAISLPPVHDLRERHYARDVQSHQAALPNLGGVPQKIVKDLRLNGLSKAPLADLGVAGTSRIISLAQDLVAQEMGHFRAQAEAGIAFLMMRPAPVVANPELYLFGLNPMFLDIAEAYIGLPVGYDGVSIQYTVADGAEVATRDWHRDREDRRMMKIIVYLNDVDTDGGPFQQLPFVSSSARKQRYLYSLMPEERAALAAGKLGTPVDCEGPVGTAVFSDTARFFHRGKPAVARDRSAIFFSYFAQRPQYPFFCDRSGLPHHEIGRIAQGLSPRQRSAALWRDALPLPWRLIPSASII